MSAAVLPPGPWLSGLHLCLLQVWNPHPGEVEGWTKAEEMVKDSVKLDFSSRTVPTYNTVMLGLGDIP